MNIDASTPLSAQALLPYASPLHSAGPGDLYRQNESLIVLNGVILPPYCILCGADGWRSPIRLTFTWDSSFHVTRESKLQLREQAAIHAYLCATHRARWSLGRFTGATGIALSVVLMAIGLAVGIASESSDVPRYTPLGVLLVIAGFAVMIFSLFFFTFRTRTLSCATIQQGYLYLTGAGPEFLEKLSPLPLAEESSSKGKKQEKLSMT